MAWQEQGKWAEGLDHPTGQVTQSTKVPTEKEGNLEWLVDQGDDEYPLWPWDQLWKGWNLSL